MKDKSNKNITAQEKGNNKGNRNSSGNKPSGRGRPGAREDTSSEQRNKTAPQGDRYAPRVNRNPKQADMPAAAPVRTGDFESLPEEAYDSGAVIGRNAVRELLKSGRETDKLFVRKGDREGSIVVLIAEAKAAGIPVVEVEKGKLDSLSGGANHQGVVALAAEKAYSGIDDILDIAKDRGEAPLIIIADGITDPYNLGTLIRCAEGVGAHGLIIPKRRASGLTPLVSKASAGAVEHLAVARVPNITAAIEELKAKGVWIYAAEAGGKNYYDCDFRGPCAIVLGSEGEGISRLVLERSDFIVSIPMYGKINSFNVSTAAAVILAEVSRQHRAGK